MSVKIEFDRGEDLVIARAIGVLDAPSDELFDREVAAELERRGCRRVLMDLRQADGNPTPLDSFHSGSQMYARGFKQGIRIAILDREEFREVNEMYELVARNRGFLVKHFYTEDEAVDWLGSPDA